MQSDRLFALIMPKVREGLYPSLIDGFEHACTVGCRQLMVCGSRNDLALQAEFLKLIVMKGVAGLAFVPTNHPPTPIGQMRQILERRIPLVFCHRRIDGICAPLVTWSGVNVGCMAAETFLKESHRRVAVLVDDRQDQSVVDVVRGMRQTCEGVDGANVDVFAYGERLAGLNAKEAIRATLKDLLEQENRPTAVFCANLSDAERVFLLADELGCKVPDDLSLICFGCTWRESEFSQRLTCVAVDERDVGMQAYNLLVRIDMGQLPHDSNVRVEVALTLLPGRTVAPPNQSDGAV